MTWVSTWTDLMTIVSSAPYFGHRRAADALLCREEVAELGLQPIQVPERRRRDERPYSLMRVELGLRDGDTLTQWASRNSPERYGLPADALVTDVMALVAGTPSRFRAHLRFRPGRRIGRGGTPHAPKPQSTLDVARAEVGVFAAELVAQVIDDMGAPAWAAARAVYE